jgi:hypothetical protein
MSLPFELIIAKVYMQTDRVYKRGQELRRKNIAIGARHEHSARLCAFDLDIALLQYLKPKRISCRQNRLEYVELHLSISKTLSLEKLDQIRIRGSCESEGRLAWMC